MRYAIQTIMFVNVDLEVLVQVWRLVLTAMGLFANAQQRRMLVILELYVKMKCVKVTFLC